jgi:hypothetical protein
MTDLSQAQAANEATPDPSKNDAVQRLQKLCETLNKYWDEAVNARSSSGIETQWTEDEEYYAGIDEANRERTSGDSKPPGMLMVGVGGDDDQCTEFVNITATYVDTAAAKIGDILQPTDERAWSIKATPVPELVERSKGVLPVEVVRGIAGLPIPEDRKAAAKSAESQAVAQKAKQLLDEAKKKAERAQTRVQDWHTEGNYAAAVREVIEDAAKVGTGILKGPVPQKKRQQMFKDGALIIDQAIKPVSKRVDYWNVFPAPGSGQNPRKGKYIWERDYLAPVQLEQLKGGDGYLSDQIDLCLDEGPQKKSDPQKSTDGAVLDDKNTFEIRYFTGYAERADLEAAGWAADAGTPKLPRFIPVTFEMVNGRVIKAALNPLDTGEFPYDFFRWKRKKNSPWGQGVARAVRTPQRIVTAAVRTMLINAGRAAGPLIVLANGTTGADGYDDIIPWKVYRVSPTAESNDATKAVALVEVPALTDKLMAIVQMGLKLAEDTTGIPLLMQGQKGNAPETLGGQVLVDRNAAGNLRRIARLFDDDLTEPSINRYYTYLLLYGESDIEKGEFIVDARGSIALVEREINRQFTASLLQASLNPKFGLDPHKTMAEDLRANNRDPEDYQYTEEEWTKLQQQKPPPDPRLAVAQVHEQEETKRTEMELQAEAHENALDRALEEVSLQVSERLQGMKSEGDKEQTILDIKAMLAEASMKVSAQMKLSGADIAHQKDVAIAGHKMDHFKHSTPQIVTPPTEPAGTAPPGEAFEK